MLGVHPNDSSDYPEFVEVDPTGRYGRYNELLGKGASKTVYRAFDEYNGMEVAWNQVKVYDFLQSPDDLERLYCEIHLLKTLKHKNIMKFYASWVNISKMNINFVTEMFTSGTLRQYRKMHRRVHIRAVKHWCRQILMGLIYLHSHEPPIIHRDLKCDNIFINGNQGEVKIGDLGLAAILRKSHAVHCVGTPEFMAPEVYEEEYNELVDIYSFGMCVLEMVTFEYPYSECTNPAQIYKKVTTGAKPDALYRVKDPEVRQFIEKCLATASQRLSARELLMDPFLHTDGLGSGSWVPDMNELGPISRQPSYSSQPSTGCLIARGSLDNEWEDTSADYEKHGIDLLDSDEDEKEEKPFGDVDIAIKGRKGDDGGIFIRFRIGDNEGHVRNIHFPFDVDTDTALGVAAEMVDELDITDHEVARIAEMIDGEVSSLVPEWKTQMGLEEEMATSCYHDCESNASSSSSSFGSHLDHLAMSNSSCCANLESCEMHGQFEEIKYQGEVCEQSAMEGEPVLSSRRYDGPDVISRGSEKSHYNKDGGKKQSGDSENKVSQDPRWMKLMYKMRRGKDSRKRRLGRRAVTLSLDLDNEPMVGDKCEGSKVQEQMKSFHLSRRFSFRRPDVDTEHFPGSQPDEEGAQRPQDQATNPRIALEKIFAAKSYYNGDSLPTSLPRTRSLRI